MFQKQNNTGPTESNQKYVRQVPYVSIKNMRVKLAEKLVKEDSNHPTTDQNTDPNCTQALKASQSFRSRRCVVSEPQRSGCLSWASCCCSEFREKQLRYTSLHHKVGPINCPLWKVSWCLLFPKLWKPHPFTSNFLGVKPIFFRIKLLIAPFSAPRFLLFGPFLWAFMVTQSRRWKDRKEYIGFLIAGGWRTPWCCFLAMLPGIQVQYHQF